MKKQFTKDDLQTGHIIVTNEGNAILIGNKFFKSTYLKCGEGTFSCLEYYDKNLTNILSEVYDIEKVYKIVDIQGYTIFEIIDKLPLDSVELIWERKKEIDWRKIPKFTRVQVRNYDNSEWENRYFIGHNDWPGYPYCATKTGKFAYQDGDHSDWKQIRIYDESEIKEEWYK